MLLEIARIFRRKYRLHLQGLILRQAWNQRLAAHFCWVLASLILRLWKCSRYEPPNYPALQTRTDVMRSSSSTLDFLILHAFYLITIYSCQKPGWFSRYSYGLYGRQGQEISSSLQRPDLFGGPPRLLLIGYLGLLHLDWSGRDSPPCSPEVKNDGAMPPLPHTSLWHGASLIKHREEQIYMFLFAFMFY
jgi:hypothetical protein